MNKKEARLIFKKITNINVKSIEEIYSGFSNQNFIINDAYILRILRPNRDETLLIKNEIENYKAIENLKISEKLVYLDENNGIKITKFIHQTHYYSSPLKIEEIKSVAKNIKKLHKLKTNINHKYDYLYKLNCYKNRIPSSLYLNKEYEDSVISKMNQITKNKPLVMSHNDLVKGNILFSKNKTYFIDWEYGSLNYEYFDLASFISENNLNNKEIDIFLNEYYKAKLNETIKNRISIFIKALDILFYYWACYYYFLRKDSIYKEIANEKKYRITSSLHS